MDNRTIVNDGKCLTTYYRNCCPHTIVGYITLWISVPLGDKKETILELIENCNKLERKQKDKFKSRIENDALRKLEVEGLLSILNN